MVANIIQLILLLICISCHGLIWKQRTAESTTYFETVGAFIGRSQDSLFILGGTNPRQILEYKPQDLQFSVIQNDYTIGSQISQSSVEIDNMLYMLPENSDTIQIFNLFYQEFPTSIYLPNGQTSIKGACVAKMNYLLLIIGGKMSKQMFIYNTFGNVWSTNGTPLPVFRAYHSCQVINNTIYLIGGQDPNVTNSINSFKHEIWKMTVPNLIECCNAEWIKINVSLSIPRVYHRSVTIDSNIYIIGGYNGSSYVTNVEVFNTNTELLQFNKTSNLIFGSIKPPVIAIDTVINVFGTDLTTGIPGHYTFTYQYFDVYPTLAPTFSPTLAPSCTPSITPTFSPTETTFSPTRSPSTAPTLPPTNSPTMLPTIAPTFSPTMSPTFSPTFAIINAQFTISELQISEYIIIGVVCVVFVVLIAFGMCHNKRNTDYNFRWKKVFKFGFHSLDLVADIFLLIYIDSHINNGAIVFTMMVLTLVLPSIIAVITLYYIINQKWMKNVANGREISEWMTEYSFYLYLCTVLIGSLHDSINLFTSNVYNLKVSSLRLEKTQFIMIDVYQGRISILIENIPQTAIQIYLLFGYQNQSAIVVVIALFFSATSIIATLFAYFTKYNVYRSTMEAEIEREYQIMDDEL